MENRKKQSFTIGVKIVGFHNEVNQHRPHSLKKQGDKDNLKQRVDNRPHFVMSQNLAVHQLIFIRKATTEEIPEKPCKGDDTKGSHLHKHQQYGLSKFSESHRYVDDRKPR